MQKHELSNSAHWGDVCLRRSFGASRFFVTWRLWPPLCDSAPPLQLSSDIETWEEMLPPKGTCIKMCIRVSSSGPQQAKETKSVQCTTPRVNHASLRYQIGNCSLASTDVLTRSSLVKMAKWIYFNLFTNTIKAGQWEIIIKIKEKHLPPTSLFFTGSTSFPVFSTFSLSSAGGWGIKADISLSNVVSAAGYSRSGLFTLLSWSIVGSSMGCRWIFAPLWISRAWRITSCITMDCTMSCRVISALAPGPPPLTLSPQPWCLQCFFFCSPIVSLPAAAALFEKKSVVQGKLPLSLMPWPVAGPSWGWLELSSWDIGQLLEEATPAAPHSSPPLPSASKTWLCKTHTL